MAINVTVGGYTHSNHISQVGISKYMFIKDVIKQQVTISELLSDCHLRRTGFVLLFSSVPQLQVRLKD